MEHLLPHLFNTSLDIVAENISNAKLLYEGQQPPKTYPCGWHYPELGGIENDNSKLRTITIVISNWERECYIPYIINQYYYQDYPLDKLEILVVDDDSVNKEAILIMMQEQVKLYPELKIRFIQNYYNCEHGAKTRRNIGFRHASNDIVVINESDTLPINADFLRGICYTHNLRERLHCIPMACSLNHIENNYQPLGYTDLLPLFKLSLQRHSRIGHDYITSLERKVAFEMRGYDQNPVGWGGGEGNLVHRLTYGGGLIHLNTAIMSIELPNFPQHVPNQDVRWGISSPWCNEYTANDENWGITKQMKEFNLYE
jgi:hypothetical protein